MWQPLIKHCTLAHDTAVWPSEQDASSRRKIPRIVQTSWIPLSQCQLLFKRLTVVKHIKQQYCVIALFFLKSPSSAVLLLFFCIVLLHDILWLTQCKAHAESHISNGIHASIDRHMTQVHQVAHDGHHWGVHHAFDVPQQWETSGVRPAFISEKIQVRTPTDSKSNAEIWKNQTVDVCCKWHLWQEKDDS